MQGGSSGPETLPLTHPSDRGGRDWQPLSSACLGGSREIEMPEVTSCSVEASKVFLASHFQNLGLKSHFWGVCRFSFWRIPHIPWFLLDLQPSQRA